MPHKRKRTNASDGLSKKMSWKKDCAIITNGTPGSVIASGKRLGKGDFPKIDAILVLDNPIDADPWMGFVLGFSLGKEQHENESAGLGVKYNRNLEGVKQLDEHRIRVRFPRGKFTSFCSDASLETLARFPKAEKDLAELHVILRDGGRVEVDGFGMPYANQEHPSLSSWLNNNTPIVDGVTLVDLLRSNIFHFIVTHPKTSLENDWNVNRLRPPFNYPYGDEHGWNIDRDCAILEANRSNSQLRAAYRYRDDDMHLTVCSHLNVQQVAWRVQASREIKTHRFPAYFIPIGPNSFYLIVKLPILFRAQRKNAWDQLVKTPTLSVNLLKSDVDRDEPAIWDAQVAQIAKNFSDIGLLRKHLKDGRELVLLVRRPREEEQGHEYEVKTFANREEADRVFGWSRNNWNCVSLAFDPGTEEYERRVNATCQYAPDANPTSPLSFGQWFEPSFNQSSMAEFHAEQESLMFLHRLLMRGVGFWVWSVGQGDAVTFRPLPTLNYLNVEDVPFLEAVLAQHHVYKTSFPAYLMDRILGLSLIMTPPGSRSTTTVAILALLMRNRLGPILLSGPSDLAVDNLADKVDRMVDKVTEELNGRSGGNGNGLRRQHLVVQGHDISQEVDAFYHLLKHPRDFAGPTRAWGTTPAWRLQHSLAGWVLVCLGSQATEKFRKLSAVDSLVVHGIRETLARDEYSSLRDVATGAITWDEYAAAGRMASDLEALGGFFRDLIQGADFLCITPSLTNVEMYKTFLDERTKGVAIDEAGKLNRGDLASLWGNTLLPLSLGGDPSQVAPVLAGRLRDTQGNFHNRHVADGKISALGWFQGQGFPVYRLGGG